ncbi:MAG TPA: hypothetical protein VII40_00835 [Xanthobacteraceae bacterium]|jgi:hypothetical protein
MASARGSIAVAALLVTMLASGSPILAQVAISGPILPSERQTTQTPRTVAASEYRDAYCAKWTDGCVACQRPTANDEPLCQPTSTSLACERTLVSCQALLNTVYRVCLAYTDGCNRCVSGYCTAVYCGPANYMCTSLRRDHYDNSELVKLDLQGHWLLTDPQGRSCELVFWLSGIPLTEKCLALDEPVTQIRGYAVTGGIFQLTRQGGEPLLTFDTANLTSLVGVGQSRGYRLIQLEPEPFASFLLSGSWTLTDVKTDSVCNAFLTMRPVRIDQHDKAEISVPNGVGMEPRCVSRPHEDQQRSERPGNEMLLPAWTNWQTHGHDITFRDEGGHATIFTYDPMGY